METQNEIRKEELRNKLLNGNSWTDEERNEFKRISIITTKKLNKELRNLGYAGGIKQFEKETAQQLIDETELTKEDKTELDLIKLSQGRYRK